MNKLKFFSILLLFALFNININSSNSNTANNPNEQVTKLETDKDEQIDAEEDNSNENEKIYDKTYNIVKNNFPKDPKKIAATLAITGTAVALYKNKDKVKTKTKDALDFIVQNPKETTGLTIATGSTLAGVTLIAKTLKDNDKDKNLLGSKKRDLTAGIIASMALPIYYFFTKKIISKGNQLEEQNIKSLIDNLDDTNETK